MILEIKKQFEDVVRAQQLLKKLPAQKLLPLNSVCYLHVQIPNQERCIVSLEADYAAEVSLETADQILQRRRERLEQSFNVLREQKSFVEMQQDLGNKIDEDLIKKEDEEQKLKEQKREMEQKKKEEEMIKARLFEEEMKKKQNVGQVTSLGENLFEIEEKYIPETTNPEQLNEEKENLLLLIQEAILKDNFDDYQKYQKQLETLKEKISITMPKEEIKEQKKVQAPPQLTTIQEEEMTEEQPKKVSKFKQDRMKQKK